MGKAKKKLPPKWTNVYPQGTKTGDEEQKFFIALARHPKYTWRSVPAIAKESGLTKERVEQILQKYYKKHMVFPSTTNDDNWAYWERVPEMLEEPDTLTKADQKDRVDKAAGAKP